MKTVITVTYSKHPTVDWEVLYQELQETFEGDMYSLRNHPNPRLDQIELHPEAECPDLTHDRAVAVANTVRAIFVKAGYDQKKKIYVRVQVADDVVT